jgi:mannose-6-phosphate isomerase-like protein (cupin superfamily)
MIAYELLDIEAQRSQSGEPYSEFLRVPAMSMGLYVLEPGADDPQQPHTEDEVYYVISGRGKVRVADEDRDVQTGTVIFVAAHQPHYFHSIEARLSILVFFAPAEYSNSRGAYV